MICPECGKQQADGSNFCNSCGFDLRTKSFEINEKPEALMECQKSEEDFFEDKENENNIKDFEKKDISPEVKLNGSVIRDDVNKIKDFNNNGAAVKDKNTISISGILGLSFGLCSFISFIVMTLISGVEAFDFSFKKGVIMCFLCFMISGLVMSIISIYKDNSFDRVIFSFYINFTMFVFSIVYLGYILFQM